MRSGLSVLLLWVLFASLAHGQWLPESEQTRLRAMWDQTGVDFPTGGKFYSLPRVSQRLVKVVNSGIYNSDGNGIYDANYQGANNINQQYPWTTPAGLAWSPKEQWTKAALASFPPGKEILVWRELTSVPNSLGSRQNEYRLSWRFPTGTVFAEMLIRRHEGKEWAFEIRERVRGKDGWEAGTTYRPYANVSELPLEAGRKDWRVPPGKLEDFGVGWTELTTYALPAKPMPRKLVPSRLTLTASHDAAGVPRGYLGNVMACNQCHSRAGESTSYGSTAIPGADGVISWHPFAMDTLNTDRPPVLDTRWPVRMWR